MASYKAPLRDMRFVYNELFDYSEISSLPGYEDATPDLVDAIIEEAAKVCENELFPINRSGDEEGCTFENGVVRTPKGFKEAYRAYVEGGWGGLTSDPKYGGQGMPSSIHVMVEEMMCSANLSFGIYPGLTYGAYQSLHAHGTDELKDLYLPKMVSGEWSGTM
ncbi:MAG: acyl-CoA dehydrogenase family protein, partial [Rhodospirillales bacterium]|nr:acyl-CoA dehydrogenase family protein [Rhodospirillales bacterium]